MTTDSDPVKLLLVDDNDENLVALEALLRGEGLELLAARSGAEALEMLLAHDVSLALLDVQMPEMDGFELAELMRGSIRTRHVPIIFITAGMRDPSRVFKGYESGAVDFLFKPIDAHVLRSKVGVFVELARQRRALVHALRLNEMFVGIISHDLRNPLGAIISGSEVLGLQLTDERHRKTLRWMTSAGRRMKAMIDQLLDLTRARLAGGAGFVRVRERVDVAELVQRTIDELRASHPDRDLALELAPGERFTSGDPERLLQLFSNLVGNALAHGTPGTPIDIVLSTTEREVVVAIHNHGAILPELLPALFEPFRGKQQRASRSGGLGLGLYIAQEVAKAHDGAIDVESSATAGTWFRVRLRRYAEGVVALDARAG